MSKAVFLVILKSNNRVCEIRVPTYQRPQWLREALLSLQNQTVHNWKAIVLDDDPLSSALPVVHELNDSRISYLNTSFDRGCVQNLSRAFRTRKFFDDSYYFSVLEDDNWYYPMFLEAGIAATQENMVDIVFLDQEVWVRSESEKINTYLSTLSQVMPRGVVPPEFIRASLFLSHSISNGSLFWTANSTSDFSVPSPVPFDSYTQEMQRALSISEKVYVSSVPYSAWSDCSTSLKHRSFANSKILIRGSYRLRKLALSSLPRHQRAFWLEKVYDFHRSQRDYPRDLFVKIVVRSSGFHLLHSWSLSKMIIKAPLQFLLGLLNL